MLNTSELETQEVRNTILIDFNGTLTVSGYNELQRTNIFNRGLKGYENLRMLDRAGKTPLHRRGKDTLKARFRQKLMGKTEFGSTSQSITQKRRSG